MELKPLDIREDVSLDHAYFQTSLPSPPHLEILVVRFTGTSAFGCANNSDAVYMDAMLQEQLHDVHTVTLVTGMLGQLEQELVRIG